MKITIDKDYKFWSHGAKSINWTSILDRYWYIMLEGLNVFDNETYTATNYPLYTEAARYIV